MRTLRGVSVTLRTTLEHELERLVRRGAYNVVLSHPSPAPASLN